MALPSNKSISSSSIAGRTSPSARNSESGNPMRRSFSGNPFTKPSIVANPRSFNPITPANSPSDYPRRNSITKESILSFRDSEEKENGKDQNSNSKPSRIRSPSVTKSSKHFMSPTISAASKIANSPKKKILGDRNEPVRSSLSLNSVNQNADIGSVPISDSAIDAPPHKASKTVRFADFEVISDSNNEAESLVTEESDCVTLDPSFKISPVSSPIIAPLDADPLLMPPYDPKTNYLSPRPQFLHYRPNPRIERYLRKEPDGTKLEDFFISESEITDETESEHSRNESDEESSIEMVKEEQVKEEEEMVKEEEEEELYVSEPYSPIASISSLKPQSRKRFKFGAMLFLLLIASFSIFVVNFQDPNILERPSFLLMEDPSLIYEFAKVNYNGFIGKFKVWRADSISFINDLVFNIRVEPSLIFYNISDFYEDLIVNEQCLVGKNPIWEEEKSREFIEEREEIDTEIVEKDRDSIDIEEAIAEEEESFQEIEAIDEASDEYEEQEAHEINVIDREEVEEIFDQSTQFSVLEPVAAIVKIEEEVDKITDSGPSAPVDLVDEQKNNTEFQYQQPTPAFDSAQAQSKVEEITGITELTEAETQPGPSAPVDIVDEQKSNTEFQYQQPTPAFDSAQTQSEVEEITGITELTEAETEAESGESMTTTAVMSALLLVISLVTLAGLVYSKRAGSKSSTPVVEVQQLPLLKKQMSHSPEKEEEPMEMAGESCSSEMSSFQYSTRGGGGGIGSKGGASSEAHSQGRKMRKNSRRESLASSSMEEEYSVSVSPSYGSFTTYERIPIKHGNGEDETVTPVRRSSRIRKQVTSP